MDFFRKVKFFKIATGGKFAVEYVSNDIIAWKWLLTLIVRFFGEKSENF